MSDSEFHKVLLRLENHTVYESAKILREKWVLELDNGKGVYVDFITSDTDRNTYQVMDKAHRNDVVYKNRYDVTFLINGLPLVQIELKRAGVELNEAVNQIDRYRRFSFKGLFRFIQIFVISNSVQTKYFANLNERTVRGDEQRILKSLVFYWTDKENKRINRLAEFTEDFLDKFSITEMITKYMVVKETEPTIMVMRFSGTLSSCIHRYMIKEAIADGNVLRFSVEYRKSVSANCSAEAEIPMIICSKATISM